MTHQINLKHLRLDLIALGTSPHFELVSTSGSLGLHLGIGSHKPKLVNPAVT